MTESYRYRMSIFRWLLIALSLAGIGVTLSLTPKGGLIVTPDSVSYMAGAQNLVAGRGLLRYEGIPYISWPPLYPVFIALISLPGRLLGIPPLEMLRYAHALLFTAVIYTSGSLFFVVLQSRFLGVLAAVAVLVGFPVYRVANTVWSELLFLLLINLFVLWAYRLRQSAGWRRLVVFGGLVSLLTLERYIGGVFIATGALWVACLPRLKPKQRLFMVFMFLVVASLPLTIWLGRNYVLTQTLTGPRRVAQSSLFHELNLTVSTLVEWFIPTGGIDPAFWGIVAGFLFLGIVSWPLLVEIRRLRLGQSEDSRHLALLVLIWGSFLLFSLSLVLSSLLADV